MPIYVYGCRKCGAVEEHIQRFSDPPLTRCEACGGKLEKKVTSAAFHLKGGGWYRDGYASARPEGGDGGGGSDGADASSTAKSDGGGDSGSSTPEAKPSSSAGAESTSSTKKKSSKKKTKASA